MIPNKKYFADGGAIPAIGLGTHTFGGLAAATKDEDAFIVNHMRRCIEGGVRHIDTAEMYAEGHTEELVGQAMKGYREKIFLTTKVRKEHLRVQDLVRAAEKSLERLRTDRVDLYLAHHFNEEIPLEETAEGLLTLLKRGKTRYIGVSNFPFDALKQMQQLTDNKIAAVQYNYNLWDRAVEKDILPYCREQGILFIASRPLGKGNFVAPLDEKAGQSFFVKYGKTAAQVALNWLLMKKNVVVIPRSRRLEHVLESLHALDFVLGDVDREYLDHAVLK